MSLCGADPLASWFHIQILQKRLLFWAFGEILELKGLLQNQKHGHHLWALENAESQVPTPDLLPEAAF